MWWLLLEVCSAFFIFIFIVWWTMFCGRKPAQPKNQHNNKKDDSKT